ncbi:MAG: hypothetical protein IPL32_18180 [Chloracidobacterium sp.]|nr:hypothetical protein [Chloracidobacterium sp.]
MTTETILALFTAVPSLLAAMAALYITFRKTPTEVKKTDAESHKADAESHKADAEANNLHAQVADRWAEHVLELQKRVEELTLDVAQVRRENEKYRIELNERDEIIADMKDWASRLIHQIQKHAPEITPEQFIRHRRVSDKNITTQAD